MRTLVLLMGVSALHAQSELALRQFFEGKQVRVKIDMPATHDGIDYYYRRSPALDFKKYSDRLRHYGIALRNGDEVMVTTVRLKPKNIEFQLGGGGYGVWGDDTGSVSARSVYKSSRERSLEKEIDREKDSSRRSRLRSELDRLRREREREERYERQRAEELSEIKKQEIAQKRLSAGSRFNLWFPENYLKEQVPTPEEIMGMLAEWIDFGPPPRRR